MKVTKRLRALADLICEPNSVVVDVGADHGYLSKILLNENRAKHIIATDISSFSLKKAEIMAKENFLSERMSFRVGDGLNPVSTGEADFVIIAGIGGIEIIKILQTSKIEGIKKYILQPVQSSVDLRLFLNNNGYFIEKDFIIKDNNKFYSIFVVCKNNKKQVLSKEEKLFGLTNFDFYPNDFKDYLCKTIKTCEIIKKQTKNNVINENNLQLAKKFKEKYFD